MKKNVVIGFERCHYVYVDRTIEVEFENEQELVSKVLESVLEGRNASMYFFNEDGTMSFEDVVEDVILNKMGDENIEMYQWFEDGVFMLEDVYKKMFEDSGCVA